MDASPPIAQNIEPLIYEIRLKNRLDELESLSAWINQLSEHLQLSSGMAFRLEISLLEAATNVIEYAYVDAVEHTITISLHYLRNTIHIEIRDDGQPFDPFQRLPVQLPDRVEDAEVGGLGIHLICSYTDERSYHRENDQNVLSLVFRDSN